MEEAAIEERRPLHQSVDNGEDSLEQQRQENDDDEEVEYPQMPFWMSIVL